jgi:hypothetical protein
VQRRNASWSAGVELDTVQCYWSAGNAELHGAEHRGTIQHLVSVGESVSVRDDIPALTYLFDLAPLQLLCLLGGMFDMGNSVELA